MTEDTRQINIVVSEQQKDKWDGYADSIGESLSHLIRSSVEREIATGGQQSGSADVPDDLTERLSTIQQQNHRLKTTLEDVERRVVSVESAIQPPDRVRDLANKIIQQIPSDREYIEDRSGSPAAPPNTLKVEDGTLLPTTIEEIAHHLDEPEAQITDALDLLQSETHMVKSDTFDGETCYWSDL